MKLSALAALLLALLAAACGRAQSDPLLGDWRGVATTPAGDLTIVLTLQEGADGALGAVIETVEQAPGVKFPVAELSVSDEALSFRVPQWNASYAGTWSAADETWIGVLSQGIELPLNLSRGDAVAATPIEGLDGRWEGSVNRNGVDLRLILRITTGERGTIARLDSPDLGAMDLQVADLHRDGERVSFAVPLGQTTFDGALAADGASMTGAWTRVGQAPAQVTFTRAEQRTERARPNRPQTPMEPFGYRVEEASFDNPTAAGVRLAGTLTLPEGEGPFPAAVLISGSGPQDRDEAIFGHKPFAVLADHLTRSGIAVLRYDDRGFAQSTGDFSAATWSDSASDASAAVAYLKTRPEIDARAIGVIGHSEGGAVGPIAAADNDDIAFVICLAGPGTNFQTLILSQRRLIGASQGASQADLDLAEPVIAAAIAEVSAASDGEDASARVRALLTADALASLGAPESARDLVVGQLASDWMMYALRYDPAAVFGRIDAPVLAIGGSLDRQVPPENLAAIEAALVGNADATVKELEGLNHFFQTATTGAIGEYADIEETLAPVALETVSDWINARFGAEE